MIASVVLGLLSAGAPPIVAPPTVDVVVLSRHRPRFLRVEGGCSAVASNKAQLRDVSDLRVVKSSVKACGVSKKKKRKRKKACVTARSIELTCHEDVALRVPTVGKRRFGRSLKVRVLNGTLRVVANLERERYVAGVVVAELKGAPPEAAHAQAILARTFALRAIGEHRHDDAPLCDLTHCQVFAGFPKELSDSGSALVLANKRGELAPIFFHSTCGGETLSPRSVWGDRSGPEIVGVADVDGDGRAWCRASPHFRWVEDAGEEELASALERLAGRRLDPTTLDLESTDERGIMWWLRDREGSVKVNGAELHLELSRALGFSRVKSSRFVAARAGRSFRLTGEGLGHRVGLCQVGALARAKAGQTAEEILQAYFPRLALAEVETPAH